ncbi:tyrosine-type recombinase/integrase [Oceanobacillus sp. CAU 1775]
MKSEKVLPLNQPFSERSSFDWIDVFVQPLTSNNQNYSKKILIEWYLYHGVEWRQLTFVECQTYLNYLVRVHQYRHVSNKTLKKKVDTITKFLTFLERQKFSNINTLLWKWKAFINNLKELEEFNKPKKKKQSDSIPKKKRQMKEVVLPTIISDFLYFLDQRSYMQINKYKNSIKQFFDYLIVKKIDINIFYKKEKENLLFESIEGYEKFLSKRISNEEIEGSTATNYLRAVQLFIEFLCSKDVVGRTYSIPIHMRARGNRANQFVPKESIIRMMNMIYDYSNHVLRDLAIFLLIVDTGCRPIEVCNLLLSDYNKRERTLPFECGKSDRRALEISHEVADVINDYLEIRDTYSPQTESLFLDYRGFHISSSLINLIFYDSNIEAFGISKYPARAFRHTYITNALEEYDFQRVSKIVGHKEWRSTNYYVYRSTKRLLNHTFDKSPI